MNVKCPAHECWNKHYLVIVEVGQERSNGNGVCFGSLKHILRIVLWGRGHIEESSGQHITDWCLWVCMWYTVMCFGLFCLHPESLVPFSWGPPIRKVKITQNEFWMGPERGCRGISIAYLFLYFWLTVVFGLVSMLTALLNDEVLTWFWGSCYWGTPLIFFSFCSVPNLILFFYFVFAPATLGKIWGIRFVYTKQGKVIAEIWERYKVRSILFLLKCICHVALLLKLTLAVRMWSLCCVPFPWTITNLYKHEWFHSDSYKLSTISREIQAGWARGLFGDFNRTELFL